MKFSSIVIVVLSLFLYGCGPAPRVSTPRLKGPLKRPSVQPRPRVSVSLPEGERLKGLVVDKMEPKKTAEQLFSFSVRNQEIDQLFLALSRQIPYDIVVDPDVSGKVTVDLRNVDLKEALDTLTSLVGAEYRIEGNIIRVSMPKMITRIFTLNYISTIRKGTSTLNAVTGISNYTGTTTGGTTTGGTATWGGTSGEGRGGSTIETGPDTADLWKEIETGLKTMISKKGNLVINKLSNLVLVTDYPKNLNRIAAFLERVEGSIHRQVMIQAKVVEVTLSNQYKMGLDWSAISKMGKTGGLHGTLVGGRSFAQALSPETGVFQIGLAGRDFAALLDAMAQQGKINVLSSPKISTLNNQKAVIKVGRDEVFFQPDYSVERDQLTGTTRSVLTGVTPQTVTVGVVLDVTPQIDRDGTITMHIHPSVTNLVKVENFTMKGEVYATAPVIDVRETDTVVRARDGQTIIIAGMMQDKKNKTITKVPFLGDIPGVGSLFRRTEREKQKTELVILLTPTVVVGRSVASLSKDELEGLENKF